MASSELPNTNDLIETALRLPIGERVALVNAMLESMDEPADENSQEEVEKAWQDEIARRRQEIENGEVETVSSSELWRRLGGKPDA